MTRQEATVKTLLTGLYTLTTTHCGTGQARGAVDLPIAREAHTDLPVIPATSVKGVVRSGYPDKDQVEFLFGPDTGADLKVGALIFTEGKLLAFPVRALARPFFYVTCPLIIERFSRDLRAFDLRLLANLEPWIQGLPRDGTVLLSEAIPGNETMLVLEDLLFDRIRVDPKMKELADQLTHLLPKGEAATRQRFARSLALVPDAEFMQLVKRLTPVQARIKLNEQKTTTGNGGNLWYEETLPADCLFSLFVRERSVLKKPFQMGPLRLLQIGGNETVGQGQCWWTEEA